MIRLTAHFAFGRPSTAAEMRKLRRTPLQAFVLQGAQRDGQSAWSFRNSEPMNLEELLGALTIQVDVLRRKLVRQWEDEDDDE